MCRSFLFLAALLVAAPASAELLLYEPFNYTPSESLGGADGSPVGQTNTNAGGGTWHARGTAGTHDPARDAAISAGNLSYAGLAPSVGNSVSYGSATGSTSLYANSISLPTGVTSGSLYASFIVRLKSNTSAVCQSPASFVTDVTPPSTLGSDLSGQSGSAVAMPGGFWTRRDPLAPGVTNFSPGKSSSDGIGAAASGASAGWQHSGGGTNIESNQFGDVDGQTAPDFGDPSTYQSYFVVLKYSFDALSGSETVNGQRDAVSLWVNPGSGTLGSATGEADASQAAVGDLGSYYAAINAYGTQTPDAAAINSFALIGHRQSTENSMAVDFDELRIGTTWESVTPVPEPSTALLTLLGIVALAFLGRRVRGET